MHSSLTTGSPWRAILFFAIPLLIGNVVQQLYQVVDAMVVGQSLGVDSLAAVGTTGSIIFLVMGFSWGLTTGFAIPTAQAHGADDLAGVRQSVAAGTILTALASVIVTVAGVAFSRPLLQLLQTPEQLLDEATTFAVVSFLGATAIMYFNYLSAIIRATGDSRTPLVFLVIASVINIGLVVLMVRFFHWGVGGAALATVIAQLISAILCLVYMRHAIPELRVRKEDWAACRRQIGLHLRLGLPMGFQSSIIAIGALAVQVRLNLLGTNAIAAFTAASRVDGLAVAFLASLGLAVSTYVAQNFGANLSERIVLGVRQALVVSAIVAAAMTLLLITLGNAIVTTFLSDANTVVIDMAHEYLVINGALYVVLSVLFVIRGALQGLGKVLVPTISGIIELVLRVAAAVVLGGALGYTGVVYAAPLAWLAAVLLLVPSWLVAKKELAHHKLESQEEAITRHRTAPVS